jgi:hypothetical protein
VNDREQLEELVKDMTTLKASIKKNRAAVREMMIGRHFSILSFVLGLAVTGFSLTAHFLSASFGSFEAIPLSVRIVLFATIGAMGIAMIVGKMVMLASRAREIESIATLKRFLALYYSNGSLLHSTLSVSILIVAGSVAAAASGHPWLCVPLITCLLCFPTNDIAAVSGLGEYYVLSYWCLASGLSSLFFVERFPFLALALTIGGASFVFAALALVAYRRRSA